MNEQKLRSIIREEILKEQNVGRKYADVAREATDKASENPKLALRHVLGMLNACESITVQLERSNLDQKEVQALLGELQNAYVTAEMLFQSKN